MSAAALALEQQGLALKAAGRLPEAIAAFGQLTRLTPNAHGAHYNLANTLLAAGRLSEAVAAYQRAIAIAPEFIHAYNNLGVALINLKRPGDAAVPLLRAAAANPQNPATRHLAGMALLQANRPAEALPHLTEANRLAPNQPQIVTDLAAALRLLGRLREVAPLARQAAALRPGLKETWNNLANAERDIGNLHDAAAASRRALALDAQDPDAHCNLAMTLLVGGQLQEAWPHWEYRWHGLAGGKPPFPTKPWEGGPVTGTLYLHAEQGLGDTIHFARYAPLAAARIAPAGRVILSVQKSLLRLIRTLQGAETIEFRTEGDPIPAFTAQAPLMSLPLAFGTSSATIPADTPYLSADPAAVAVWAARLAALPGRKIGLAWAGNRDFHFDALRSVPPAALSALAGIPGTQFVSLQFGAGEPPPLPLTDVTPALKDFADTAALIAALDLTIAVDTATIHLAGALNRPAWLLNRFAGDWRWENAGTGCAWYPSVRQFRQNEPGDWGPALQAVRRALLTDF
jgi:tetratricopeptide (TPR) repeat protein